MERWECTDCKASVEVDMDSDPIQYHALYPVEAGPYAEKPVAAHRCPIKRGYLPAQMAETSNARRVS